MTRASFSLDDAKRIANVVRAVEEGNRNEAPLRFRQVQDRLRGATLQLATFSGDWQLNQVKTVTFHNVTSTPNTANVRNFCVPALGFQQNQTAFVICGRVQYHTTERVVLEIQQASPATCTLRFGAVDLVTLASYVSNEEQLLGHDPNGCPKWFSVTTCATATASV